MEKLSYWDRPGCLKKTASENHANPTGRQAPSFPSQEDIDKSLHPKRSSTSLNPQKRPKKTHPQQSGGRGFFLSLSLHPYSLSAAPKLSDLLHRHLRGSIYIYVGLYHMYTDIYIYIYICRYGSCRKGLRLTMTRQVL